MDAGGGGGGPAQVTPENSEGEGKRKGSAVCRARVWSVRAGKWVCGAGEVSIGRASNVRCVALLMR